MAKATAATPTRGRSVSRGPASTKKPASPASSKDARRSSSKSQAAPVRKASKSPAVRARSVAKTTKPISNVSPTKRTKKTGLTNPVTEHFEFSGPYLGPLGIVFGLPILVWMFSVYCGQSGWPAFPTSVPSWDSAVSTVKAAVPTWEAVAATFSWEALGVYTAWFALQAVLHVVVPGRVLEGVTLRDGSKLKYKVNGACDPPGPASGLFVSYFGSASKLGLPLPRTPSPVPPQAGTASLLLTSSCTPCTCWGRSPSPGCTITLRRLAQRMRTCDLHPASPTTRVTQTQPSPR